MSAIEFSSALAVWFTRFCELKQATGAAYRGQALILHRFDRYLVLEKSQPADVDARLLGTYLAGRGHLAPRTRANIVSVVWPALEYAIQHGAPCPPLPARPTFPRLPTRVPVILTETEIERLLLAARSLPPEDSLRPHTHATLFGLLATTGIRSGEAGKLEVRDLDPVGGRLMIREGKFRKSRRLPIHASTVDALTGYLARRRKAGVPLDPETPLLINLRGRCLVYENVRRTLYRLCESAGLLGPDGRCPRLHDLRHGFAIRRVIAWYRAGVDVNTRLRALRTYLGHVSVEKTLAYLRPHEAVLGEAARRFEAFCAPLPAFSQEESGS